MVTLREFLKMIRGEHYRIYQPNRDCLIFESYLTIHSPYDFKKELAYKEEFYSNNPFNDEVRHWARKVDCDQETADFLDEFGDYEVFSIEASGFRPYNIKKDEEGKLHIDNPEDAPDPIDCFNIFIIPYHKDHGYGCRMCHHSLLDKNSEYIPDAKDMECRQCRYLHG